ncbi:hypothetical protein ABIA25_002889 [Sinorhizobium fredii]
MNPLAPTTAGTHHSITAEFSSVSFDLPGCCALSRARRGFFLVR